MWAGLRLDSAIRLEGHSRIRRMAPRHDAIAGGAVAGVRQPESGVRSRFTGVSRADGIAGSATAGGRQPKSGVRSRFTGVSRADGITGGATAGGRQRGFSLLEILLVMALIAATGVLAAGVLTGGFDRMTLRSSAKEVAAQLRFTRAQAIATGSPQRFTIDPAARTWQGAKGRDGQLPASLDVHFIGAREVRPAAGVGAIVFFGDGASTGGRVRLSLRDAAWDIEVAWLTGEVALRRGELVR